MARFEAWEKGPDTDKVSIPPLASDLNLECQGCGATSPMPPMKTMGIYGTSGLARLYGLRMLHEDDAKHDLSILMVLLEGDDYCFVCTEEPHLTSPDSGIMRIYSN
jgi:hypothetical protein